LVSIDVALPKVKRGQPTWTTALLFPRQGEWTEEEYFALEGSDNRLKELSKGCLEILPIPSAQHQRILRFLIMAVHNYLTGAQKGGEVLFAPLPVRLWPGTVREPDLIYLSKERVRRTGTYPEGADLVMEIVSESRKDRKRDLVIKRREYARAGIAEYWIVDPKQTTVTVLSLNRKTKRYRVEGSYKSETAVSKLLSGFEVCLADLFTPASRS
jgi:Uma2 family endonuclease